jgi:hypothetical protein
MQLEQTASSAEIIAALPAEQRASLAPKLAKIERALYRQHQRDLARAGSVARILGSAAGRASPEGKELCRLLKGLICG